MSLGDCVRVSLFPLTLTGVFLSSGPAGARGNSSTPGSTADTTARGVYHLTSTSRFEVRTGKAGLFGFAGHSHLVRARSVSGFVEYQGDHPTAARLEVIVPAESLQVLTPNDTSEIRKVTERMRTQVLNVAQYPDIRFTATVAKQTQNGFRLNGELTMVGRTQSVPVDAAVSFAGDTIKASGKFSVKQSDFGIKPVSAGPGGSVKVADRVNFAFDAVAVRQ